MSILTVIPARGNSKRVPGKNIRILLGKPLIAYTIEKALESNLSDKVVVSTDSKEIADIAIGLNSEVIMRPAPLALDISPIDDSLRHAVTYFEKHEAFLTDIVVLLQANIPIRMRGEIDKVITRLQGDKNATAVATGYLIDQRPEWMKIIDEKTDRIRPFLLPTDKYRIQDLPKLYLLDGSIIAVKKKVLMETESNRMAHAYLGDNVLIEVHDQKYSLEVDEEKDFEMLEYYLNKTINDKIF